MMQVFKYPERSDWKKLLQRPYAEQRQALAIAGDIIEQVSLEGDVALKKYARQFDGMEPKEFLLSEDSFSKAEQLVPLPLQQAIQLAAQNIKAFHQKQIIGPEVIETMPGVHCWRKSVGIEKVGLYIPGGTAPLFSTVLMLGIPAKLAGCKEIILCTPASANFEDTEGIHPAIIYSASLAGISKIFKVGGAQAIAAMAVGTASIRKVDKIFGPGNQYVTAAKQLVQMQGVAIDMPAGPSEVCVLADDSAHASFIAADLLSQAEHGADSQVLLVTTSEKLVEETIDAITNQLEGLPRKSIAEKALRHSRAIVVSTIEDGLNLVNEYAAEHLIICCEGADELADKVINAGSVFIGNYSPEAVGDYASGTNHTLPTNGYAKAYSGVSVDAFTKKITYQKLSPEGLKGLAEAVGIMAEAEGLQAHANAVKVRREN